MLSISMTFMLTDKTRLLLAVRVKAWREKKKWSQTELAKKAGVNQKTISNLENINALRQSPTLAAVESVARVMGLEAWQILAPDDKMAFPHDDIVDISDLPNHAKAAVKHTVEAFRH